MRNFNPERRLVVITKLLFSSNQLMSKQALKDNVKRNGPSKSGTLF